MPCAFLFFSLPVAKAGLSHRKEWEMELWESNVFLVPSPWIPPSAAAWSDSSDRIPDSFPSPDACTVIRCRRNTQHTAMSPRWCGRTNATKDGLSAFGGCLTLITFLPCLSIWSGCSVPFQCLTEKKANVINKGIYFWRICLQMDIADPSEIILQYPLECAGGIHYNKITYDVICSIAITSSRV